MIYECNILSQQIELINQLGGHDISKEREAIKW